MTDKVVPTPAELKLLGAWQKRIDRLHEDVTGQWQVHDCFDSARLLLEKRGSRFVVSWMARVYIQWAAIGVRRAYRRGSRRQNVSLHGLLLSISKQPTLLRRHGNQRALRTWLGLPDGARVTNAQIVERISSEITACETEVQDVEKYANTIAHLEVGGPVLKKQRIVATLNHFRRLIARLYGVLAFERPKFDPAHFVTGYEDEFFRLLR